MSFVSIRFMLSIVFLLSDHYISQSSEYAHWSVIVDRYVGRAIGPSRFESCLYLCGLLLLSNEVCYRERAGRLCYSHGKS
jgi:hypothetical protein